MYTYLKQEEEAGARGEDRSVVIILSSYKCAKVRSQGSTVLTGAMLGTIRINQKGAVKWEYL